jgi:glyoxylase-like metal-dependent hydrolase (beta-lactamase superfamily II)
VKTRIREIAEGLYMITLPMPFRLKYVNIFAAVEEEGITLIDTGPHMTSVLPALEASLAEIGRRVEDCRRILITHFHADHCGLAGLIAGRSGAGIFLSEIDDLAIRTFVDQDLRMESRRRFGRENGLDAETLAVIEEAVSAFRTATTRFTATGTLSGGERLSLGGRVMEVVSTPGHSRGHLSFYLPRERVLIAGDHVLPHITPNLSPDLIDPAFRPLESFLKSLERVASLSVERVYPAHGRPFDDLRGRVAEIREHHRERKALALAALAERPKTAAEVSRFIFGPDLPPFDRYLALSESYVHLIELAAEGVIRQEKNDGLSTFRRT